MITGAIVSVDPVFPTSRRASFPEISSNPELSAASNHSTRVVSSAPTASHPFP
jgi:hypothetical protein